MYARVALPMLGPGLVTVFLFQLTAIWNNLLPAHGDALDQKLYPVSLGLYHLEQLGPGRSRLLPVVNHRFAARGAAADRRLRPTAAVLAVRGLDRRSRQ